LIRSVAVFGYPLNGMVVAAHTPRPVVKLRARQEPESAVRGDTKLSKQHSQATDCQASVRTEVSNTIANHCCGHSKCSVTDGMSAFGQSHALVTASVVAGNTQQVTTSFS